MDQILSNICLRKCIGVALLMSVTLLVLAQAPNSFRHLQKSDGLSQSSVFSIAQDSSGFMWFGTRDGLNRYNGHDFRIFRSDSNGLGPLGSDVRTLLYDTFRGGLWVGTTDGLSFYSPIADRFEHYPEVVGAVRNLHEGGSGRLWVSTSSGLYTISREGVDFEHITLKGSKNPFSITVVVEVNDTLWIGANQGLFTVTRMDSQLEYQVEQIQFDSRQNRSPRVESLYPTKNGTLFIGTFDGGVFRYNIATGASINYRHEVGNLASIADDNVRAIHSDGQGGLWIATFNGLSHLDIDTESIHTNRATGVRLDELSDNSIHCILKDLNGSLWIGTYHGGVNHLDPMYSRFRSYINTESSTSLGADIVSSFAEDEQGNIYVGTEGGGLDFFDVEADVFRHFRPNPQDPYSLSGSNVKSLLLEGDQLWVGTFKEGLNLLDLKTGRFKKFRAKQYAAQESDEPKSWLPDNNVYSLVRNGKYIWIATYGGGLSLLDTDAEVFSNYAHDPENAESIASNLAVLVYKKNGQFWVGTDAGLQQVVTNDVGLPIRFETILSGQRIRVIYQDDANTLWAGTLNAGLYRIDGSTKEVTTYSIEDGLAGNTVYGILEDDQGKLWLSTNDGLSQFDPSTGMFTNFEHPSGMSTGEFNHGAYLRTQSGDMLFGGLDGFTRFNPSEIKTSGRAAPLVFTDFSKNGQLIRPSPDGPLRQNINTTNTLTLAYNDANFNIGLAALDYLNPERNIIQYKLDGLDKAWKTVKGKARATYTIQREGEYTLQARTISTDGQVSGALREIRIKVLPPPWRTWWAYLGYLTLAGLSVYGILRFVRLRHSYDLEHLARQQDEELHEGKLRFFTNITHEFRTPLTLILGPLGDLLKDKTQTLSAQEKLRSVERNTRRLLDLVDRVLTFRKLASEHGRLRGDRNDLNWFLRKLHEPFFEETRRRGITLELDAGADKLWVWFDPRMLEMAITSLLLNALKFTPDGGKITLSGKRIPGDQIEINVIDNGCGIPDELKSQVFQRFFEDPSRSHVAGSGIGLSVASELIALHQGSIHVEDTVGGGATIVVRFPVGTEHFSTLVLAEASEKEYVDEFDHGKRQLQVAGVAAARDVHAEREPKLLKEQVKSRVLIVEDNEELRKYLEEIFKPFYEVVLASDGREGLAMVQAEAPDLVLSDVMMPFMDGLELCKKLKTNLKTSHIPILLLTAKTGEHARLDGLRIGAEDYIPKPFVPEELLLRVRNTLDTRHRIREKFTRVINLDPSEISVTSADEEFLVNALAFVEEHIDDLELNVVRMASALNVSRALLFTKLKALTNQTPGNFIKVLRIKRAAQLLSTNKLNVAEVAYRVGFRDPKYFSKCFKEEFGVSASGFKKQHLEGESSR